MTGIIYLIENHTNGKRYVGQTKNKLKQRIANHLTSKKSAVGSAIRKYGKENFTFNVLYEASSQEELDQLERKFIQELGTLSPHGYNLTTGGEGGYTRTEETKKKLSLFYKGRQFSEETKKKISLAKKGIALSESHKNKISLSMTGSKNHWFGKSHSDQFKENQSLTRRGPNHPMFGKHHNIASLQKMSQARSKSWCIIFPNGDEEIITNLKKFCTLHNLTKTLMLRVAKGKAHQHKGFRCKQHEPL